MFLAGDSGLMTAAGPCFRSEAGQTIREHCVEGLHVLSASFTDRLGLQVAYYRILGAYRAVWSANSEIRLRQAR